MSWPSWRTCLPIVALLGLTLLLTAYFDDRPASTAATPALELGVPLQIGAWQRVATELSHVRTTAADGSSPYTEQVLRTYRNPAGQLVMLTLAYNQTQTGLERIHDPQFCYPASGFELLNLRSVRLHALEHEHPLQAQRMLARRGNRLEAVSYWIRIGELHGASNAESRWYLTRSRLRGRVPDGILVRASTLLANVGKQADEQAAAHQLLEGFLAELISASPESVRGVLRL